MSNFKKDSMDANFRGITPDEFKKQLGLGKIKLRYEWLDPHFLKQMAIIATYGGLRYGAYNWQGANQTQLKHYEGAIMRHMQEYRMGNFIDSDHDQSHMASVAVNACFIDFFRRKFAWGFRNK